MVTGCPRHRSRLKIEPAPQRSLPGHRSGFTAAPVQLVPFDPLHLPPPARTDPSLTPGQNLRVRVNLRRRPAPPAAGAGLSPAPPASRAAKARCQSATRGHRSSLTPLGVHVEPPGASSSSTAAPPPADRRSCSVGGGGTCAAQPHGGDNHHIY